MTTPSLPTCTSADWKPLIYSGKDHADIESLKRHPSVLLHDEILNQVRELLKSRHPERKLKGAALETEVERYVAGRDLQQIGVWVYYPWSRRLVHLLPEEEFIETRVSPNNPKITREEQDILRSKKVGVVGLSVGQSISTIMAMERICGELRIADFDQLELANLNRIRSGVHNMGLNKCVLVAREIMEMDPFIRLRLYTEGLTLDNMDAFFNEGGRLDLIVDECDSVEIKLELRLKAKSLGIPVVMDMSDRGTLDIERFDLEPERPVMHGWLEHLDIRGVGNLSNEDKVPYMMPFFGIDTISKRLKASMIEIGESIHTWPQLATSVAMGGALAADTVRRIFLDYLHDSGRYFVDLDLLVRDKEPDNRAFVPDEYAYPPLNREELPALADRVLAELGWTEGELAGQDLEPLITGAGLAPSAGNNQPWLWLYHRKHLFLFHEKSRSWNWTDFDDSLAMLGLGAAAESLRLAAGKQGYRAEIRQLDRHPLVAACRLLQEPGMQPDPLAHGIGLRCTNRKPGVPASIADDAIASIAESLREIPGTSFHCFRDRNEIDGAADAVGKAEKLRFLHPQGHYEFFKHELRWNDLETESKRDGLDIRTLELSPTQQVGLQVSSDPEVMDLVRRWNGGKALEKMSGDLIRSSSAIGLITCDRDIPERDLRLGAALMRVWTMTNLAGWSLHPISAPLFFMNRVNKKDHQLSAENITFIQSFERNLYKIMPILQEQRGVFMFRISKSEMPETRSLRHHLEQILTRGN